MRRRQQRSLWLRAIFYTCERREAFLYAGGNQNASRTLEGSAPNHLLSTDKCRVQQLENTFVGTPPYPSSPARRCKRPLGPRSIGPCLVPPPGKLDPGAPAYSNMASRNRFAPKLRSFTLLISISASLSNETPLSRKLVQAHLGKKCRDASAQKVFTRHTPSCDGASASSTCQTCDSIGRLLAQVPVLVKLRRKFSSLSGTEGGSRPGKCKLKNLRPRCGRS